MQSNWRCFFFFIQITGNNGIRGITFEADLHCACAKESVGNYFNVHYGNLSTLISNSTILKRLFQSKYFDNYGRFYYSFGSRKMSIMSACKVRVILRQPYFLRRLKKIRKQKETIYSVGPRITHDIVLGNNRSHYSINLYIRLKTL